jgi:hypothetical protein
LIYSRNSQDSIEPKGALQRSKGPANFSYLQRETKRGGRGEREREKESERERKRERERKKEREREKEAQFTEFTSFYPFNLRCILLSRESQWSLFFRHRDKNSIRITLLPQIWTYSPNFFLLYFIALMISERSTDY